MMTLRLVKSHGRSFVVFASLTVSPFITVAAASVVVGMELVPTSLSTLLFGSCINVVPLESDVLSRVADKESFVSLLCSSIPSGISPLGNAGVGISSAVGGCETALPAIAAASVIGTSTDSFSVSTDWISLPLIVLVCS